MFGCKPPGAKPQAGRYVRVGHIIKCEKSNTYNICSSLCLSNIGRKFLALIEQHFPLNHELQHICNKNTLKLSYSCMNSMGNIIKSHNNRILQATNNQPEDKCNCRNKDNCPLPGKCTTQNVIYEATVTTPSNSKKYIGLTANSFKKRYTSHKASFTKRENEHSTELSKHIWKLKDQNIPFETTWRILKHAQPYTPSTKRCNLCTWEKYYITIAEKDKILNSRSELVSTCRHRRKFLVSEYG